MIAGEPTMPSSDELGGASVSPSGRLRITPNAISVCLFGPTGIPFRMSDLEHPSSPTGSSLKTDEFDGEKSMQNIPKYTQQDLLLEKVQSESLVQSSDTNFDTKKINTQQIDSSIHEPVSQYNSSTAQVGNDSNTPYSSPELPQHSDYVPTRPVKMLNGTKKTLFHNESSQEEEDVNPPEPSSSPAETMPPTDSKTKSSGSTAKSRHIINIHDLRRLASQGIPDSPFYPVSYSSSLRAIAWRVLLGYLPVDTSKWANVLKRDRTLYRSLVNELFLSTDDIGVLFCSTNEKNSREKFHSWQVMSIENEDENPTEIISPSSNVIIRLSTSGGAQSLLGLDGLGGGDGVELLSVDQANSGMMGKSPSEKILGIINEVESIRLEKNDDHAAESPDDSVLDFSSPINYLPSQVRDQWKKSCRSLSSTDGYTSIESKAYDLLNALLIVDDDGCRYSIPGRSTHVPDTKPHSKDTKWSQFFENTRLLDEIRKDVDRTHPNLQFFLEPEDNLGQRRYAAIERILFVWAKLNRGVRYVQGMNEIVGTMYYVLANDPNDEWACEAEADTYFLFNTLMIDMKDIFVPDLDDAETGIQGRMTNMIDLLSLHDPEVQCHLDECGIGPAFYSIRWLTTLLSREFTLPDTIRLWDSMFASTYRDNFLRYVCVTMVILIRESLLQGDFGTCLRLLQSYPPTNIDQLLEASRSLWIYESQVTLACHQGGISLNQAMNAIVPPPTLIMAFGLHAGEKLDQLDVIKNRIEDGKVVAKTLATNARTLLGNARDLLGLR